MPTPPLLSSTRAGRPRTAPPGPAFHRSRRIGAVAAAAALVVAGAALARDDLATRPAVASVTPASGFSATVLGWTSWYGAYDLGGLGWGWCIDHGSAAPDPDLAYAPTSIDGEADPTTRAALAWAATTNPPTDAVTAAATMLALHDLRGAAYPFGELDVDRLGLEHLAGFGGAEAVVLERARAVKADALAHAHLRAPFTLAIAADRAAPGRPGALRATLTDAGGTPVAGAAIDLQVSGAAIDVTTASTGTDGVAWFGFLAGTGENRFTAHAVLPRPDPAVHAPTLAPAQRVIVPAWASADGADAYTAAPPTTTTVAPPPSTTTTTTTRPSTTTTARPVTTTTTAAPTTTTTSPRRTTTTTVPSSTSTSTTSTSTTSTTAPATTSTTAPATTTTPAPPARVAPPTPPTSPGRAGSLPVTGTSSWPWALIGTGLVLGGWALTETARQVRPAARRATGGAPRDPAPGSPR